MRIAKGGPFETGFTHALPLGSECSYLLYPWLRSTSVLRALHHRNFGLHCITASTSDTVYVCAIRVISVVLNLISVNVLAIPVAFQPITVDFQPIPVRLPRSARDHYAV